MDKLIAALRREQERNYAEAEHGELVDPALAGFYRVVGDALGNVAAELEDGPPDE